MDSVTPCRARQRLASRQAAPHAAPRNVPDLVARRPRCAPDVCVPRLVAHQTSLRAGRARAAPRCPPSRAACRPCCVPDVCMPDVCMPRRAAHQAAPRAKPRCAPAVLHAAPNLAARRAVRVFHVKHTHAANFWQPPLRIAYPKGPALPRASRPQPHFAALMAQIRSLVRWQTLARHPLKRPTWGFASRAPAKQGYQAVFASRHRTKLRICATFPQKRGSEGGGGGSSRRLPAPRCARRAGCQNGGGAKKRPLGAQCSMMEEWPPAGRCRVLASRVGNSKTGGISGCAGGRRN